MTRYFFCILFVQSILIAGILNTRFDSEPWNTIKKSSGTLIPWVTEKLQITAGPSKLHLENAASILKNRNTNLNNEDTYLAYSTLVHGFVNQVVFNAQQKKGSQIDKGKDKSLAKDFVLASLKSKQEEYQKNALLIINNYFEELSFKQNETEIRKVLKGRKWDRLKYDLVVQLGLTKVDKTEILDKVSDPLMRAKAGDTASEHSFIKKFSDTKNINKKRSYLAKLRHIGTKPCAKALFEELYFPLDFEEDQKPTSRKAHQFKKSILKSLGEIYPDEKLFKDKRLEHDFYKRTDPKKWKFEIDTLAVREYLHQVEAWGKKEFNTVPKHKLQEPYIVLPRYASLPKIPVDPSYKKNK